MFKVGPESPNYRQLLEFAQTIHPDDFGLGVRGGSTTAVRYELKFRKKRTETWADFAARLDLLRDRAEQAHLGAVTARDSIDLAAGEAAATVTDTYPKLSLVAFADPATGLLITADRVREALARPDAFRRVEIGILPRMRAYGIETADGIRLTQPGYAWVDLKSKRVSDPRIIDKPRAAFAVEDWRQVRFEARAAVDAARAAILARSRALGGADSESESVLDGFRLIAAEYRRQTGRAYAPEEGYITHREAWVVKGTPIQATQDRAYRRTEPLLEAGLRAGDLASLVRPVVLAEFQEPIFAEFKYSPGGSETSRGFERLLRGSGFDLRLKSQTQGKRYYSKRQLGY